MTHKNPRTILAIFLLAITLLQGCAPPVSNLPSDAASTPSQIEITPLTSGGFIRAYRVLDHQEHILCYLSTSSGGIWCTSTGDQ